MDSAVARETILLQVPQQLPCYAEWDFRMHPGIFALYVDRLCAEVERNIRRDPARGIWGLLLYSLFPSSNRGRRILVTLQKALRGDPEDRDAAAKEHQSTIWWLAREVIYSGDFSYYECPACERRFPPDQGSVQDWSFGEGLAAQGGRRLECPGGHTVYAIMDWVS